jgi:hypothetical protein
VRKFEKKHTRGAKGCPKVHFVFWQTARKSPKTAVNLHRTALPGDVERRAEVRLYPVLENTPSVSAF